MHCKAVAQVEFQAIVYKAGGWLAKWRDVTLSQPSSRLQSRGGPGGGADRTSDRARHFRRSSQPGGKLREEDLAERFGASRHHVREALVRLIRAGIIVKERNKGAYVRRFSADEVRQIYEIREILQRQAALRISLPAASATIERLERINEGFDAAVAAGAFQRMHEWNDRSTPSCSACATTICSSP